MTNLNVAAAALQEAIEAELRKVEDVRREMDELRACKDAERAVVLSEIEELRQCREKERAALEDERRSVEAMSRTSDDMITINAGGTIFQTRQATLCVVPDSLLAKMFSGRWDQGLKRDAGGAVFLDVSPRVFEIVLSHLRALTLDDRARLPAFPPEIREEARAWTDYLMLSEPSPPVDWKIYSRYAMQPGYDAAVTLFAVDKLQPCRCSLAEFKEFAARRGLRIPAPGHPGQGTGYSSQYQDSDEYGYRVLADFWNTVVLRRFPNARYDQALVMHGSIADGFAHNHEPGSLHALGDPTAVSGGRYSYCRAGDQVAKQYHIYVCCGTCSDSA